MEDAELVARTSELISRVDPSTAGQFEFRGEQFDAGLAWVHFPVGKGGLGASRGQQAIVDAMLREAGCKFRDLIINPMGIGMGAPTLLAYADDAVQREHLRPIFTGENIWCQMFSEPSSGSDVAGLHCLAERDGDEWVVNGQKVWTTLAHVASYGMLLARTDPDAPKHAGLTYFLLDMHAAGVEVRPLYQITGEAEFNEIFLTDVRIPHSMLLGGEGNGWKVATTTLMNERVALGGGSAGRGGGPVRHLIKAWESARSTLSPTQHAIKRDAVVDLWARAELVRLTNQRAKDLARGGAAGPEGSIGKLLSAELNGQIFGLALELEGARGQLHEPGYPMTRADSAAAGSTISAQFLRTPANTIEGGTSEVMRNILGERVLGLPSEPRVDKNVPWRSIPK